MQNLSYLMELRSDTAAGEFGEFRLKYVADIDETYHR